MNMGNRSLLERAADIYDFSSGLRVDAPADLPPPRVRAPQPRLEPVPAPEPRPVETPLVPAQVTAPARPPEPSQSPQRSVCHHSFELDRQALGASACLLPDGSPGSRGEEMRLVKRRLLAAVDARAERGDSRARTVLVASGSPGEGKSFTAINLALSLAGEQDRAVLLIDGDTSKPELPARLGFEPGAGLVDALADHQLDPEALVLDTDLPGLSVLPAGRRERNVPELLASGRADEVLQRLLAADPRRIILIDSPPALAASTAAVLAGLAGQALVVVRADATSEADLKETLDLLSAAPSLSLVLNSTAFSVRGRRYGQYEERRPCD